MGAIEKPNVDKQQKRHHYVRTVLASVLGTLAIWLILLSVMIVWLNRTLTDTNTFVDTVTPLASQPAVKDYISEQISSGIDSAGSDAAIVAITLTPDEIAGKTPDQLQAAVKSAILSDTNKVLMSEEFESLWSTSVSNIHYQLIKQLDEGASNVSLDLSPALSGATNLLSSTRVAPIVDRLDITPDQSTIVIKSDDLAMVRSSYNNLKRGTAIVVIVAVALLTLAVSISVHHTKTLRRIGLATGISLAGIGLMLLLLPIMNIGGPDASSQALVSEIASVLLRSLKYTTLIAGLILITAVIASKIITIYQNRSSSN